MDVRGLLTEVFGRISEQVDAIRIEDPRLLVDYHPPVTAGQRLVSIQGDCLQHLGQAAYVVGFLRATDA